MSRSQRGGYEPPESAQAGRSSLEPPNTDPAPGAVRFPMDRESNWDICPVCLAHLARLAGFPGFDKMRRYHEEHKRFGQQSGGSNA